MEQGNFIIGAISAEEMIKTFVKNGAEVVGDRDYKVVYLKNVNDENDIKGVVYYVDNYFDFDPDFPECPKVQVLIGDPRNKYSFVSSTESAATEVQNFINKGYEEFCYTTSRDIDLYIPETITGTSGRRVTVMDYVVGDEERGDEYPYSIGATVLKDRGCSVHSNCAPWTVEDVEGIIDSVFDGPVIVNPTNREILTAFDLLDIIAESEETFEC